MAGLSTDSKGRRVIQFTGPTGKRCTLRLGRMKLRNAETVCTFVESLLYATTTRTTVDPEAAAWLRGIGETLHKKLEHLGLARPRAVYESPTLGEFFDDYLRRREDIKPSTRTNLENAKRYAVGYFGEGKHLDAINEAEAEDYRRHLEKTLSANTVRRCVGRLRQVLRYAVKKKIIAINPLGELRDLALKPVPERFYFVSRETAQKVLDSCPNATWRAIFAMARFGGLRTPSEIVELRWSDIDWANNRFTVRSTKTEKQGKGSRVVPLFPEVRRELETLFEQPGGPEVYVINHGRTNKVNWRTQLERILYKAGLAPWEKLFQNLRSSRQTELCEDYPLHVVTAWLGNTAIVASKHYLQVTDAHFDKAARACKNDAAYAGRGRSRLDK